MYVDIHTDHGKHFHFEVQHVIAALKGFANKLTLHKTARKLTTQGRSSQNFHADEAFKSRHSRTYIGPL